MHRHLIHGLALTALLTASATSQEKASKPAIKLTDVGTRPIAWGSCDKEPDWLNKCPRLPGRFSFATVRRGSNSGLAQTRAEMLCTKDVRAVLRDHLQPGVGDENLVAVLDTLIATVQLAEGLIEQTRKIPGARGPGQTVGAAYMRWQIPVREAVGKLPAKLQGRVEWLLLRDVVRWQSVDGQPRWVDEPPRQAGSFRCVLVSEGAFPGPAQSASQSTAHQRLAAELTGKLKGLDNADEIVARGLRRVAAVQRAYWFRSSPPKEGSKRTRRITTTYVLWEIPLAALTRSLSDAQRTKVEDALAR